MYIRRVYTQVLFSAITCWHELGGPDVPNCTSEMLASPRLHPSRYADSRVQFCCFCTLGAQLLGPSPTRASDCAKAFAQRKEPALSLVRDCPSFVTPTIFAFCSLSVKQKNMGYWKPTLNFSKPRSELSSSILTNIWRCTRAFCGRQRSIFYRAMRVKRGGACGWSPRTRVSELGRDMVSSV